MDSDELTSMLVDLEKARIDGYDAEKRRIEVETKLYCILHDAHSQMIILDTGDETAKALVYESAMIVIKKAAIIRPKPTEEMAKMTGNLYEIMLGKNENIDMPLHEIHEVRERYKGHETEPGSLLPLLRARIAELEWCLDGEKCMVNAAKERIREWLHGDENGGICDAGDICNAIAGLLGENLRTK